jgi:hypothetical protein
LSATTEALALARFHPVSIEEKSFGKGASVRPAVLNSRALQYVIHIGEVRL